MLAPDGIAYLEIPNRYFTRFVREDGHYKLFGITLLGMLKPKQSGRKRGWT
jgi:hypothetical protein